MLDYFRKLKFTAKVAIISILSTLVLFGTTVVLNVFFVFILGQRTATPEQIQLFSTIDLLIILSLIVFGISGFHVLLTELASFPYNEHKLEVLTTIFLILFLLLSIPATLTVEQFQLSFSLKTALDILFFLVGSVYIVLATTIYYLPEVNYLNKRYTRWSIFIFTVFFGVLVFETMRTRLDPLTALIFVGTYLLGIVLVLVREIQTLLSWDSEQQENKKEIVVFVILMLAAIVGKFLDLML